MSSSVTSVTRLYGLGLSPGKLRGLQRISNDNGTLTMVATDQNSSLIKMLGASLKKKGEDRQPTYEEVVEAKVRLADVLSKHASGVLVDAYYGVWNTIASFHLPRHVGVLVRVEQSGGEKTDRGAPLGAIEPGWSVAKIKRIGADAVKLLAQFEPSDPVSSEHQYALVDHVYRECQKHDILLVLETVSFTFKGEDKKDKSYLDRKAATVLESARQLSRYCDVYKAEFPGTNGHESDSQLTSNLKELNRLSERPWVLLSAGVDYPMFKHQVEMAMECGASGVLGGRAFWKEYFDQTPEAADKFLRGDASNRVAEINDIVQKRATPWFKRYDLTMDDLHTMRTVEKWHARYGEARTVAGAGGSSEGDVY